MINPVCSPMDSLALMIFINFVIRTDNSYLVANPKLKKPNFIGLDMFPSKSSKFIKS